MSPRITTATQWSPLCRLPLGANERTIHEDDGTFIKSAARIARITKGMEAAGFNCDSFPLNEVLEYMDNDDLGSSPEKMLQALSSGLFTVQLYERLRHPGHPGTMGKERVLLIEHPRSGSEEPERSVRISSHIAYGNCDPVPGIYFNISWLKVEAGGVPKETFQQNLTELQHPVNVRRS